MREEVLRASGLGFGVLHALNYFFVRWVPVGSLFPLRVGSALVRDSIGESRRGREGH